MSLPFTTLNSCQNVVNESDFHICYSSPKHPRVNGNALLNKELLKLVKIAMSVVEKASRSSKSAAAARAPCKKNYFVVTLWFCRDPFSL